MAFPRKLRITGIESVCGRLFLSMKRNRILYESSNTRWSQIIRPANRSILSIIEDILNFIKQVGHTLKLRSQRA